MPKKKDARPPNLGEVASRRTGRDKARAAAARQARKEQRAYDLLMSSWPHHHGVPGLVGAQVCQLCARIGTYSPATIPPPLRVGPFEDFVCPLCQSEPAPDGQPRDRQAAERRALAALAAQVHRFCEGCQARVERTEERRHRGLWLCEACMKTAWAKKKALAHLLGQRFLEAGLGGDPLLWNRNVTLAPTPPVRPSPPREEETRPPRAAGDPAPDPTCPPRHPRPSRSPGERAGASGARMG